MTVTVTDVVGVVCVSQGPMTPMTAGAQPTPFEPPGLAMFDSDEEEEEGDVDEALRPLTMDQLKERAVKALAMKSGEKSAAGKAGGARGGKTDKGRRRGY